MLFGKGKPRSSGLGRRGAYRPKAERLEGRVLLAIDLGGSSPPALPAIATVPLGVDLAGGQASGGAGFSVTDLGDVNGDGFDDFLIGAPTVQTAGALPINIGTGSVSRAYLVFGSQAVNAGNIDWLTLNAVQRVGDLNQLGNTPNTQQNPITGAAGFPFNGITFLTSQNARSQLGASVARAGTINGAPAFLIGAPGGTDANGQNPFTGRAYLVYGGTGLNNTPTKTIDLDSPAGNQGVGFVTFVGTGFGLGQLGSSVSGAGDFFAENNNSIALGAPFATFNGNANAGAVFVISGTALPTTNQTINVTTVASGTRGAIFGGGTGGANAGFSLANAGSVSGALSAFNTRIPDLLIGAPGINTAYLIYGGTTLANGGTTLGGLRAFSLGTVGDPTVTPGALLGAVFTGPAGTGYAVSSAGDFNNDGFADFLIGAPFALANAGVAYLIYGQPITGALKGTISLTTLPSTILAASFVGDGAGSLAGFAVANVGRINADAFNEILIGSPGNNGNQGAAYLIPGNPDLVGTFPLSTAETSAVSALKFTLTNPSVPSPSFFGASVSGGLNPITTGQPHTADSDAIADFVIGAPGYGATGTRALDGGVFIVEGALIRLPIPPVTTITTLIGVGAPPQNAPFTVNATTPATLQIFVGSNATVSPPFDPVTQIDPTTVFVNGVAFPNATIAKDPVDENNDGIEDAIITITPRSNLGLNAATTTVTFRARTLAGTPNANRTVLGTAAVTVTGVTPPTPGGGAISALPVGTVIPTFFLPPFGPDRFVPAPSTLSMLDYKPIPWRVAYRQFQPSRAFEERTLNYFFPSQYHFMLYQRVSARQEGEQPHGVWTLSNSVFDRGLFHPGKHIEFTHKVPVIPTNRQHERLSPTTPLGGRLP